MESIDISGGIIRDKPPHPPPLHTHTHTHTHTGANLPHRRRSTICQMKTPLMLYTDNKSRKIVIIKGMFYRPLLLLGAHPSTAMPPIGGSSATATANTASVAASPTGTVTSCSNTPEKRPTRFNIVELWNTEERSIIETRSILVWFGTTNQLIETLNVNYCRIFLEGRAGSTVSFQRTILLLNGIFMEW